MSSVAQLESLLHDQPVAPLRPNQIQDYTEESDRVRSVVDAPAWQGGDRGFALQRYTQIQKLLRDQAPKPIEEPLRRDQVSKLAQEVLENDIRPAMLTRAQMRRNPAGAVDTFLKRENGKQTKKAILTWKRAMRALDPENTDQDYTNIERYRPEGLHPDGTATYMADAQISGNFAMSPQAKANWPLGDPRVETPLKQAQKREMTQAQKDALARAQAGRRASIAAKKAAGEVTVTEPPAEEEG